MTGVKMITCCYCGARDVMRMGKGSRVALNCLTCGAPVRKMEAVKVGEAAAPKPAAPIPEKVNKHRRPKHFEAAKKRKKKRKSLLAHIIDEAEDFFDFDDWLDWD